MSAVYVVGDIHGHFEALRCLLRRVDLVDAETRWTGRDATLVLVGDMVDRGQDGIGVLDVVMRLQTEASHTGGSIHALLGNHEVQLLAAKHFGETAQPESARTFRGNWRRFGGLLTDLERLDTRHVAWLEQLPAMVRIGHDLLVHADAPLYPSYGDTVAEVNASVTDILTGRDLGRYAGLMRDMIQKRAFHGPDGSRRLQLMLDRFGGRRLIHGHSPIAVVTGQAPATITEALVYADGRCVNVDHGLYLGGPGFVFNASAW